MIGPTHARHAVVIGAVLAFAGAAPAHGQDLGRMAAEADGTVRFGFPAAENVCGTGDGVLIREPDGSTMFVTGRGSSGGWRSWQHGGPPCRTGDVVVSMTRRSGGWEDVRIQVRDGLEMDGGDRVLGYFTGQEAATFLLEAARQTSSSDAARDFMLAASIAREAVIWPELLEIGRDRRQATRVRKSAIHWLGRRAARQVVDGLGGIVRDRTEEDEVREAAVFAISQLPDDQAIPLLIEVVEDNDDPRVVNRALFWLAEFDDPRAVAVFERILAGPGA